MVMWAIGQREVSATLSKLFLFDAHHIGKLIFFSELIFPRGIQTRVHPYELGTKPIDYQVSNPGWITYGMYINDVTRL